MAEKRTGSGSRIDVERGNGAVTRVRLGFDDLVEEPGEFRWMAKNCLNVDWTYQRQAKDYKAKAIAAAWSWVACGTILVADRNGNYYVIDGGHRVLAARLRTDIEELPCLVFRTRTVVEEAEGFLMTNKNRKPITAIETFQAMCITGDEVAIAIRDILDSYGREVRAVTSGANTVKCVSTLMRCYRADPNTFRAIWPLIDEVSRNVCIKERVVESLFYIECRLHGTGVSLLRAPWRSRVINLGSDGICEAASKAAAFYVKGGATVWARGVIEALNRNIRNRLWIGFDRMSLDDDRDET